jgi:hypothetical protein
MVSLAEIENKAGLARITCGWKKPELPIDWVLSYWRDVHSPAIARRGGIYDYRHYQYGPVRTNILTEILEINFTAPPLEQLMWTSDVRYLDETYLAAFDRSPFGKVKADLLGDIDLIVDKSTTYRAVGESGYTFVDRTGIAMPQGPTPTPTFALFIRSRSDQTTFRATMKQIATVWAAKPGILRLRLSLLDAPDMEKERASGYPIKTHPHEMQYQALIDISLDSEISAKSLIEATDNIDYVAHIKEVHAYPVNVVYTSVYGGKITLVGLRGYSAYQAIMALGATNQRQTSLLEWMYGPAAHAGTAEDMY